MVLKFFASNSCIFSGFSSDGFFGGAGPAWKDDEEERGEPHFFLAPHFLFLPHFVA